MERGGGEDTMDVSDVTARLAAYIAGTPERALPGAVAAKTKQHILDTLAAILSGSRLKAGVLAGRYVATLGGTPEATVIGTSIVTSAANAALANGMMGHADETDDSHLGGRFHPGCGIVPAALAIAEQADRSGEDLIKAVALGYDTGARICPALGLGHAESAAYSTHSLGTAFGAVAAAAALLRFDERQVRHALSYAAQQASGIPFWNRDTEHIEKAFDFGGMGARNGVAAATMVAAGFTATDDPFAGRHSLFTAFGSPGSPEELADGLGTRHEILAASIKKWPVGSPIQAALDALTHLIAEHKIGASGIVRLTVHMPDDRLHIVDNRAMPDVCLQHLLAVTLIDGTLTFATAHDGDRMHAADVRAVRARIHAVPSAELTAAVPARQAIVEIDTNDGRTLRHRTVAVRGTPDNPMSETEVRAKAFDLNAPIIGARRARDLEAAIAALETLPSVRQLRPLLQA
jgi:2-methylcitrate dehydratase PrpD